MDRALLVRRGEALLFCIACWVPVVGFCLNARVVVDRVVSAGPRSVEALVEIPSALLGALLR